MRQYARQCRNSKHPCSCCRAGGSGGAAPLCAWALTVSVDLHVVEAYRTLQHTDKAGRQASFSNGSARQQLELKQRALLAAAAASRPQTYLQPGPAENDNIATQCGIARHRELLACCQAQLLLQSRQEGQQAADSVANSGLPAAGKQHAAACI